jgi:hypothetical protein
MDGIQPSSKRWMTRPLASALVLAAAFGAWEMLFADFMGDDLMQLSVLEGVSPAAAWTGPLDLYTISDGVPAHVLAMQDAGLFPWAADPAFEMAFFRPLSSGLLALDHALFGLHPAGYRLHGALWSLALVAGAGWVLRRALHGRAAAIAVLVFVLSAVHGMFCWTAARHVVIAAALGFGALAAHLRWREDGWRPGVALSLAGLALSLAASEVGVAVAVYLLAYEAFGAQGTTRARLRAAAPTLGLVAVYVLAWHALGHGASAGTDYVDPIREPGAFLFELPARLAVLAGGVVMGGGGIDLWVLRRDLRGPLVLAGALVTAGFAAVLRVAWRETAVAQRRGAGWLGVAAVVSAVPFAGTPIGARCLLVPLVGGAALIAVVIDRWWTARRRQGAHHGRVFGVASALIAVVHLALAPLGRLLTPIILQQGMAERAAAAVRNAELDASTLPRQTVVVLVAPDLVVGLHAAFHRLLHRLPMPAAWRVVSWAPGPHRFVRTGLDTLEMEVDGSAFRSAMLRPGTVVTLSDMEVTVLAPRDEGATRVRIRLDRPLDDPSLTLLAWRDGRLRRVEAPPLGGVITVPRER